VIGRITTLMTSQSTLDELNQAYDRLTTTQQELSTGKKINQPSDDPYGMTTVLRLRGQLGSLTAYTNQVNDAIAYTQASQTSLTNITNMVQRVRELTVAAANGVNSQANLNATAAELDQLIAGITQEANTTYNGQYVFSGTSNVAPYQAATGDAYQGNSGSAAAVTRAIGPNTTAQINADLASVLGNGSAGPGGPDGKLLDVLRTIAADLKSGNTGALSASDLTNLDTNLGSLTALQASVGAVSNRLQVASSRLQSLQLSDTQLLSDAQDADIAQTEINYTTQQAAYTAALKVGATIVQSSLLNFLN
jgi:flagellar hook-associated protein 3 FlgL